MSRKSIDRELLISEICKNRLMSKELVAQKILHIINEQPTVNVDEERQGKWERSEKSFSYAVIAVVMIIRKPTDKENAN